MANQILITGKELPKVLEDKLLVLHRVGTYFVQLGWCELKAPGIKISPVLVTSVHHYLTRDMVAKTAITFDYTEELANAYA